MTDRSTAVAITRTCRMSSSNSAGVSDWWPSESALHAAARAVVQSDLACLKSLGGKHAAHRNAGVAARPDHRELRAQGKIAGACGTPFFDVST